MLWWSSESKSMISLIKYMLNRHKKRNPEHNFVFLCNSQREYKLFRKSNIQCIFCNHNAFIDERIFRIMPKDSRYKIRAYNKRIQEFRFKWRGATKGFHIPLVKAGQNYTAQDFDFLYIIRYPNNTHDLASAIQQLYDSMNVGLSLSTNFPTIISF